MLSFTEKQQIITTHFPTLTSNQVSLGRINFQYPESTTDKVNAVYHLHPNGNGFVYVGNETDYAADAKGLVNIRDFAEAELIAIIEASIVVLSTPLPTPPKKRGIEELWINENDVELFLVEDVEEDLFSIYTEDDMLDAVFNSYTEAIDYLDQEGFEPR